MASRDSPGFFAQAVGGYGTAAEKRTKPYPTGKNPEPCVSKALAAARCELPLRRSLPQPSTCLHTSLPLLN